MSVHKISAVFRNSKSQGTARVVLLALANYADEKGICWPGFGCLSRDANVDRRNIIRAINGLIKLGEIEKIGTGPHGSNKYKITVSSGAGVTSDTAATSDDGVTIGSGAGVTRVVAEASPKPSLHVNNTSIEIETKLKGSKIAADWKPSESDCAYAASKGYSDKQIACLAEGFCTHWSSADAKKPLKKDWKATWRKWVQNDIKFNGSPEEQRSKHRSRDGGGVVAAVREIVDDAESTSPVRRIRY